MLRFTHVHMFKNYRKNLTNKKLISTGKLYPKILNHKKIFLKRLLQELKQLKH